jgi:hypothetical protein
MVTAATRLAVSPTGSSARAGTPITDRTAAERLETPERKHGGMSVGAKLRLASASEALYKSSGFIALVAVTGAGMGLVAIGFQNLLSAANKPFSGGCPEPSSAPTC